VCILSGSAGDVISCPIQVARKAIDSTVPTAFQIQLEYPASVEILTFDDGEFCIVPGLCIPATIPDPFQKLNSGHAVTLAPQVLDDWQGQGQLLIVNLEDTTVPVTDAYFDGGVIVGDPVLINVQFQLISDIPTNDQVVVNAPFVVAADSQAGSIPLKISNLVIVSQ
jgi:hypothetical protein